MPSLKGLLGLSLFGALLPWPALAADPRLTVDVELSPKALGPAEVGAIELTFHFPDGWHLWSLDPGPGPLPLSVGLAGGLELLGDFYGDPPRLAYDKGFERELYQYAKGPVRIGRKVRLTAGTAPGPTEAVLKIRGQICEAQCINQVLEVPIAFTALDAPSGVIASAPFGDQLTVAKSAAIGAAPRPKNIDDLTKGGIFSFILMAFVFGLGALATPCVFPAIPLTVSFFSKFSGESLGRGARLAGVYAATMVLAFTGAGVLISVIFGVTGVQTFAAHPIFNLFLGLLLAFFALNLLGLFEIQAPQFLVGFANKLEGKFGRGATGGVAKGGIGDYLVVSVAALTATTVFFTCTVGFVGLVLVAAAKGDWFWPTLGMLSFASAFALPFFLLAMFPQAANRLRGKGGSWLSATRVTLGFLELAAATKFLSNADLVWTTNLLSREVVLAFWVPLFGLAGLYLLGKIKLGHESVSGEDGQISVLQMLAATMMFSLSIFLAVGLFNGRPFGGWVDGWLPPIAQATAGGAAKSQDAFEWRHDLAAARKVAAAEQRLVFVNYTGYTCTNCRYMEGGIFPQPAIAKLLKSMVLVELYTDGGTPEQDANRDDQVKRFLTAALPFYSVERADGTVLGTFPSSTNDAAEFERFLIDAIGAESARPAPVAKKAAPLTLQVTVLGKKEPAQAVKEGQWTLINFWATWCGPCRDELKSFMVRMGKDLEARNGHFVTVAMEEEDGIAEAKTFMASVGMSEANSLHLSPNAGPGAIDPRFGFDGGQLPFTVLVSPAGEVVWQHNQSITEEALKAVLVEHTGLAAR